MTKIVATFSNGFQDTYKGKRDVKAAWMLVDRASGKPLSSGHSYDRAAAQKTAEGHIRYAVKDVDGKYAMPLGRGAVTPAYLRYIADAARSQGWDGKGSATNFWKARNAEIAAYKRAQVTIEIIDL
jgi:hypothetical protein